MDSKLNLILGGQVICRLLFTISIFLIFCTSVVAQSEVPYTCPKIERQSDQVEWKCLKEASDELIYKAQMMSHLLLEQVDKIEGQLGERQDVFFIARAGSSLVGFDQLKNYDENGQRISLDEVFNFGVDLLPNQSIKGIEYTSNYQSEISRVRARISKKYINKKRPKLEYSHGGILFRTPEGVWNIYHELTPCNEQAKAYLFQDSAFSGTSSFFVSKPHKYKALIIPLAKHLQKRIIKNLSNGDEYMARGPVYRAMSNPWQADSANSNIRDQFLDQKLVELGVGRLSAEQKKHIEENDQGYKKVCRPDFNVRRQVIKSYTEKGFEPTKTVFDSSLNFRNGVGTFFKELFQSAKVTFIPLVGDHIKPNKVSYADHMKLGVGEAVTVYSIWQYLERTQLIHPSANSSLFEVPELDSETAERLRPVVEGNISLFIDDEDQAAAYKSFDKVLAKMRKKSNLDQHSLADKSGR